MCQKKRKREPKSLGMEIDERHNGARTKRKREPRSLGMEIYERHNRARTELEGGVGVGARGWWFTLGFVRWFQSLILPLFNRLSFFIFFYFFYFFYFMVRTKLFLFRIF